jgi:hypothetical protein
MLPKYNEIQHPLLSELLRRGGAARPSDEDASGYDVYEALSRYFNLSDADQSMRIYENGKARPKWQNMVRWARNDLRKLGLLDSTRRGVWALTDAGAVQARTVQEQRAAYGVLLPGVEIPPERLEQLRKRAKEIGDLGEAIVLEHERLSLIAAGRADLASGIKHVALTNAAAGFDIESFFASGAPKMIEVKTTVSDSTSFEITANEWNTAAKLRGGYWIYRVSRVESLAPEIARLQDPFSSFERKEIMLVPTSYQVILAERE